MLCDESPVTETMVVTTCVVHVLHLNFMVNDSTCHSGKSAKKFLQHTTMYDRSIRNPSTNRQDRTNKAACKHEHWLSRVDQSFYSVLNQAGKMWYVFHNIHICTQMHYSSFLWLATKSAVLFTTEDTPL